MHRAAELRKEPTPAEVKPWALVRRRSLQAVKFRRQHAIGPYIVDFCAPRHHLILEVDGSPHVAAHEQQRARTTFLESQGYRVLRFWNGQILNDPNGVIRAILDALRLIE
jgi:very-short-patch-repair endonuclease